MEQTSDRVAMGKLVDEFSYAREEKHLTIDHRIVIDHIDEKRKILHEVKLTDKMEHAHIMQMRYYLYILTQYGVTDFIGEINYPKTKTKTVVNLTTNDTIELEEILDQLMKTVNMKNSPVIERMKICDSCAYLEFCWA